MSDYRFEFVKRHEAHTGNELDCLHVMIDSNSLKEIADTHIPLDDILEAATVQGYMTIASRKEGLAQTILPWIERTRFMMEQDARAYEVTRESVLIDDIEKLCQEQLAKEQA